MPGHSFSISEIEKTGPIRRMTSSTIRLLPPRAFFTVPARSANC